MEKTAPPHPSPHRDERGASLVEFALIVIILMTLLFGVVIFGVLLSKRQVLTQAAAEGARAAVPIKYTTSDQSTVRTTAETQVNKSLEAVDRTCGDGSTTCTFVIYACSGNTTTPPSGSGDCLEVSVALTVGGAQPLVPTVGIISPFVPNTMTSKFTVTLANPS